MTFVARGSRGARIRCIGTIADGSRVQRPGRALYQQNRSEDMEGSGDVRRDPVRFSRRCGRRFVASSLPSCDQDECIARQRPVLSRF
jgi:hypothetical protein